MKSYLVKTPRILKAFYNKCIWHINEPANNVYISFDDGPHPVVTPFVLEQLDKFQAKATFFCIGKNVQQYPHIYQEILARGHAVGNHTQNHLNGWTTNNFRYLKNIRIAADHIHSNLFRPPYGRISYAQANGIERMMPNMRIIMWDVLSGDFDKSISPLQCLNNVITKTKPGSIIVFHDSEKAYKRLEYALPMFLEYCQAQKWTMKKLNI